MPVECRKAKVCSYSETYSEPPRCGHLPLMAILQELVIPHAQRERVGKVIGVGAHIYIYIYVCGPKKKLNRKTEVLVDDLVLTSNM